MTVDIRLLHHLPQEFFLEHRDLFELRAADRDQNGELNDEEIRALVVVQELRGQYEQLGQATDPAEVARLQQGFQRAFQELLRREGGRYLPQRVQQVTQESQQAVDRIRIHQVDLHPLYSAPRTLSQVNPDLDLLRSMDRNHDRILVEEEVAAVIRQQLQTQQQQAPQATTGTPSATAAPPASAATGTGATPSQPVTPPPPSEADIAAAAQAQLILSGMVLNQVPQMESAGRVADRVQEEIYELDLRPLESLPREQYAGSGMLRILSWIRSRQGAETMLNVHQAHELLYQPVVDLSVLAQSIDQVFLMAAMRDDAQVPPELRELHQWLQGFSPHYIVTERQLEERVREHPLDLGIFSEQAFRSDVNLHLLNQLAGDDHRLTVEDFNRQRLVRVIPMLPPMNDEIRGLQEWLRGLGENHVVTNRELTDRLRDHPIHLGYIPEELRQGDAALRVFERLSGGDWLLNGEDLRRMIREAPSFSQGGVDSSEFNLFSTLPRLWELFPEAQHRDAQARALLGAPEMIPFEPEVFLSRAAVRLIYARPEQAEQILRQTNLSGPLAIADLLADGLRDEELAHASDEIPGVMSFLSSPVTGLRALFNGITGNGFSGNWWTDDVRAHNLQRDQERREAIALLRRVIREHHLNSLSDALPIIRRGENGARMAEYLDQELRISEFEPIYHIRNSAAQEQAWQDFCRNRRMGQAVHWHGDFRTLLFSPWQNHYGPATVSIYNRLYATSDNQRVVSAALRELRDQMGDGGGLFPTLWDRDWADAEASFDGLWDGVGGTLLGLGIAAGILRLYQIAKVPGNAFAEFFHGIPRWNWRGGNLLQRGVYWGGRGVTIPFRMVLPHVYQGEELERATLRAVQLAEGAGNPGTGIINQQRAVALVHQLGENPNSQVAAGNMLRAADRISESAALLTERAAERVAQDPEDALSLARRALAVQQTSRNIQLSLQVIPQGNRAATRITQALQTLRQGLRGISNPRVQRDLEGTLRQMDQLMRNPETVSDALARIRASHVLRQHLDLMERSTQLYLFFYAWAKTNRLALRGEDRGNMPEPEWIQSNAAPGIDPHTADENYRSYSRTRGSRAVYPIFPLRPSAPPREEESGSQ